MVLTSPIAEEGGGLVGLGQQAVETWSYLKWPFLAATLMGLLAVLYWSSPNVRHPGWRWVTPGSVAAVAHWMMTSAGFTAYVNNFASFQRDLRQHRRQDAVPAAARWRGPPTSA